MNPHTHEGSNNNISEPSIANPPYPNLELGGGVWWWNNIPISPNPNFSLVHIMPPRYNVIMEKILAADCGTAHDLLAENSLDPYEAALLKGMQTPGTRMSKKSILTDSLTRLLNQEIEVGGQSMSVVESLIIKVLADVNANPSTSKLKDLASIMGDMGSQKVEVSVSMADSALEGLFR